MNKKRLSVVMAGAMLASSVAPVLAEEVQKSEMSADNLGLLIQSLRNKLQSATFADEDVNGELRGKSIYTLKLKGGADLGLDADSTQTEFQNAIKNLTPGKVIEVWTKAHEEKDGKYYAYKEETATYTAAELQEAATIISSDATTSGTTIEAPYTDIVTSAKLTGTTPGTSADTKLTITFKTTTATWLDATLELSVGDEEYNFKKYIAREGGKPTDMPSTKLDASKFDGFAKADKEEVAVTDGKEKVEEITITSGGNNVSVDDIYDGLMLTTKGHDFFAAIKEAKVLRGQKTHTLKGNAAGSAATIDAKTKIADAIVRKDGKYSFSIEVAAGTTPNVDSAIKFTVTGTNEAATERMANWLFDLKPQVDILAGTNRYSTAVTIAKEYSDLTSANTSATATEANIVLVNGGSLVDGLSASPLAAALTAKAGAKKAPILLTEADRLPKETKAYLREVIENLKINEVKKATIHIVGGEAVVSKDLERELKSLGFSVERYGGANREATSLEVADEIASLQGATGIAKSEAFVVGANGEADAMSIASIASAQTADKQTPIIVAKNGGISEDALYELRDKHVTIIGGEKAVSKAEEEEIGLEAESVSRIAGANRKATNAAIISKYYNEKFGAAKNVVVAKDDVLIDALTAANLAAQKQAPIVLATNKLSDEQINALELNSAANPEALYQVGIGVDKDNVVKVIAQRLGLAN